MTMSVRLRVALAAAAVFGLVFAAMAAVGITLLERSLSGGGLRSRR